MAYWASATAPQVAPLTVVVAPTTHCKSASATSGAPHLAIVARTSSCRVRRRRRRRRAARRLRPPRPPPPRRPPPAPRPARALRARPAPRHRPSWVVPSSVAPTFCPPTPASAARSAVPQARVVTTSRLCAPRQALRSHRSRRMHFQGSSTLGTRNGAPLSGSPSTTGTVPWIARSRFLRSTSQMRSLPLTLCSTTRMATSQWPQTTWTRLAGASPGAVTTRPCSASLICKGLTTSTWATWSRRVPTS
mmetsp:Transcript_133723/g.333705  ORF Transcript_133723/g.333705 Transcript_133723/m.333705 type:complete len:248 (-) Transcript_133723:626-1369(-)